MAVEVQAPNLAFPGHEPDKLAKAKKGGDDKCMTRYIALVRSAGIRYRNLQNTSKTIGLGGSMNAGIVGQRSTYVSSRRSATANYNLRTCGWASLLGLAVTS